MRPLFLLLIVALLFNCSKDKGSDNLNSLLLLQVDYMTNKFEGGKELILSTDITEVDTLPISIDYKPPGDFGNISLYYEPNHELIFDGSIIWMGTGRRKYPEYIDIASEFKKLDSKIEMPAGSKFQNINSALEDYSLIWNSVCKLEKVSKYLESNKKIGIFLYTPSVGIGDPNEWDWFLIMNK